MLDLEHPSQGSGNNMILKPSKQNRDEQTFLVVNLFQGEIF